MKSSVLLAVVGFIGGFAFFTALMAAAPILSSAAMVVAFSH